MKPLDQAFQIIEEGLGEPIGTISEVLDDGRGIIIRFVLFPGWEIDRNGFLRNKNENCSNQDSTDDYDDGTMAGYSMHG